MLTRKCDKTQSEGEFIEPNNCFLRFLTTPETSCYPFFEISKDDSNLLAYGNFKELEVRSISYTKIETFNEQSLPYLVKLYFPHRTISVVTIYRNVVIVGDTQNCISMHNVDESCNNLTEGTQHTVFLGSSSATLLNATDVSDMQREEILPLPSVIVSICPSGELIAKLRHTDILLDEFLNEKNLCSPLLNKSEKDGDIRSLNKNSTSWPHLLWCTTNSGDLWLVEFFFSESFEDSTLLAKKSFPFLQYSASRSSQPSKTDALCENMVYRIGIGSSEHYHVIASTDAIRPFRQNRLVSFALVHVHSPKSSDSSAYSLTDRQLNQKGWVITAVNTMKETFSTWKMPFPAIHAIPLPLPNDVGKSNSCSHSSASFILNSSCNVLECIQWWCILVTSPGKVFLLEVKFQQELISSEELLPYVRLVWTYEHTNLLSYPLQGSSSEGIKRRINGDFTNIHLLSHNKPMIDWIRIPSDYSGSSDFNLIFNSLKSERVNQKVIMSSHSNSSDNCCNFREFYDVYLFYTLPLNIPKAFACIHIKSSFARLPSFMEPEVSKMWHNISLFVQIIPQHCENVFIRGMRCHMTSGLVLFQSIDAKSEEEEIKNDQDSH